MTNDNSILNTSPDELTEEQGGTPLTTDNPLPVPAQDRDEQLQQVVDENSPPTEPSVLKRFMKSAKEKYDSIPDAWGQIRTNPDGRKED